MQTSPKTQQCPSVTTQQEWVNNESGSHQRNNDIMWCEERFWNVGVPEPFKSSLVLLIIKAALTNWNRHNEVASDNYKCRKPTLNI
jgi:hypothetical protein